ncbi:MAG: hypothetical protein GXO50_05340 [Chlorobi bacterium]|nr:hypothetical protein [Chlorobiota bacterium]
MKNIPERIKDFINEHHVLTLATSRDNVPYCASCFYVYSDRFNVFVFSSDEGTKHVGDVKINDRVAGTVVLETSVSGKIRGIQFTGRMYVPEGDIKKEIERLYLERYPFARLMNIRLWVLEPDFIKMTDNRLGFGKKLIWKKK